MWNSKWEYENQAYLKERYEKKMSGELPYHPVRKIVCKVCGKVFTPKRSDGVCCSNACRQKAYRQGVTDS